VEGERRSEGVLNVNFEATNFAIDVNAYDKSNEKKSILKTIILLGFGGGEEDSSARGSPSAMELTVGALNRLDKTLTEEITQFTTASTASARKATRHATFRTSKASPTVSFDLPAGSGRCGRVHGSSFTQTSVRSKSQAPNANNCCLKDGFCKTSNAT